MQRFTPENEIDKLVSELSNLTEDEIAIVAEQKVNLMNVTEILNAFTRYQFMTCSGVFSSVIAMRSVTHK